MANWYQTGINRQIGIKKKKKRITVVFWEETERVDVIAARSVAITVTPVDWGDNTRGSKQWLYNVEFSSNKYFWCIG